MTLLADKISKATKRPQRDFTLGAAVIQFGRDGGTLDQAIQIVAEAFAKLPGNGQNICADDGQTSGALSRHPVADADGPATRANEALAYLPSASASERERGGLTGIAPSGQCFGAASARGPSAAQRSADSRIAKVIAVTVLDTYQVAHRRPDGKYTQTPLGELTISLARSEATRKTAEGYVLREVVKMAEYRVANLTGQETVKEVLGGELAMIQRLIQKGAEYADAV